MLSTFSLSLGVLYLPLVRVEKFQRMRALIENRAAFAACCLALFVARMALLPADTAALTWNRAFALLTRAIARRAARKRNAIGGSFCERNVRMVGP